MMLNVNVSYVLFNVTGEERVHATYGYSIQPARDRRMAWVQVVCSAWLIYIHVHTLAYRPVFLRGLH